MSPRLVRPARPADLEAILAIEGRSPPAPGWSQADFERELSGERSIFVVLEEEGEIRGYAGLWRIPPEAQVTTIVIAPEARGRGLGRQLLEHLLEACRSEGLEKVTLEVSSLNAPALRLYESLGFRPVGLRARFYRDGSDAVLMDLDLKG